MNKKRLIAYLLLYNFIGYTVAVGGWLWEVLIFFVTEQRFVNRGFFYGPYLPVYGVGAVLLSVLFYQNRIAVIVTYAHLNRSDYPQAFYHSPLYSRLRSLMHLSCRTRRSRLPDLTRSSAFFRPAKNNLSTHRKQAVQDIRIFFLSLCGGSLTELTVGWFLWHVFHRKYWDYSSYPLNLSGYVCLFSAVGFGVLGVIWMKWVGPFLIRMWEGVSFSVQILMIGMGDLLFVTDAVFSLMRPNGGESVTFSLFLL